MASIHAGSKFVPGPTPVHCPFRRTPREPNPSLHRALNPSPTTTMRGIGAAAAAAARRHAHLPSSYAAAFSSFSGIGGNGGAGRGRGRGLPPSASAPPRAPGSPIPDNDDGADLFSAPSYAGRGRGEPVIPPSPTVPSFSSFSGAGRGRGSPLPPTPPPPPSDEDAPKQPTFTKRFESVPSPSDPERAATVSSSSSEPPRSIPTSGAGRGVPRMQQPVDRAPEENRFVRSREAKKAPTPSAPSGQPKMAPQEAVKRALELLGRGDTGGGRGGRGGRGSRGGRGGGREGGRRPADVNEGEKVFLGDNADGEKLEKRLGPEKMKIWDEAFDEAADEALPHPMNDGLLDAIHTNNMIEFEPEYNVSFCNPDIEEKPPMSLEEMLQKVKPFIVAYEGIQNQEEWEEAVKDVMERAPHMKELIDMYSGPDVVTAIQQEGELQRVANTLPENIPNSVKRFTDKTLLSLKNNPGWGFDRKCQFMDKFVREVSEQYK
uniref:Hydroxyproline-rich glycoprotein family protein n=2 Tax=Hordeum vulgare subsp. vulgare TaxID=112509 RepID=A0A8I7BFH2_HORVV